MKNAAPDLFVCSLSGSCPRSSSRARGFISCALLLVFLGTLLFVSGCSDDESDITFPTPNTPPSKLWMYDVFGNDASDVYACGHGGSMVHFNGTDWTEVDMNSTRNIVSIWGEGDGTLYACGAAGSVWRNSGSGWGSMASGSTKYLVGLGSFKGDIHVSGVDGSLLRLSNGSWVDTKQTMIFRDPNGAPLDTLDRKSDVESLVTINHYFIGGAYKLPSYDFFESVGTEDTDGMVLALDTDYPELPQFDWQLRPLRADEIAPSEWIQCSTSDDQVLGNNYLGTSEGWVFQLSRNDEDQLVWAKKTMYPRLTNDPRAAINDMWLDEFGNLYMVTHSGQVVFQTPDYDFVEKEGLRVIHQVSPSSLMGLWGEDSDNLFLVGLVEKTVFRYRYDFADSTFKTVAIDTLQFGEKSLAGGNYLDLGLERDTNGNRDKFGRKISR